MPPANSILAATGTTIFESMSQLARAHGAVNLGQGFPEGLEDRDVMAAGARALLEGPNQYPPMLGLPAARQAVADHGRRFYGLAVDWERQVMITSGATEALADCLFGLLDPGDEVVLLEPLYDSYLPIVRRAGGVPRLVRLQPPRWDLPVAALAAAFGPRTRLLLLNSPMNPTGKVFTADELDAIAGLLDRHDAYAICDEVYEHQVYDGAAHLPLAARPGMADRCVRIGSAGKIFSLTGWKVGYVVAPPALFDVLARTHQYITFATPPNLQAAFAHGLNRSDDLLRGIATDLQRRRDSFVSGLQSIGMATLPVAGSYFVSADITAFGFADDAAFCRHIVAEAGVAAVPISAFFADRPGAPADRRYARFCFAKADDALAEAVARLRRHFGS